MVVSCSTSHITQFFQTLLFSAIALKYFSSPFLILTNAFFQSLRLSTRPLFSPFPQTGLKIKEIMVLKASKTFLCHFLRQGIGHWPMARDSQQPFWRSTSLTKNEVTNKCLCLNKLDVRVSIYVLSWMLSFGSFSRNVTITLEPNTILFCDARISKL